ncbi:hypothetical protein ACMD2_18712 [Ananas comosus]|uniref:Uncharacterized protein n=1 Tax=Ananas comosus TaxID=4615 RepID=A0A199W9Y5_ANACO|nr:hypothetical protein ACMD2_18712 [Ananas comosus]
MEVYPAILRAMEALKSLRLLADCVNFVFEQKPAELLAPYMVGPPVSASNATAQRKPLRLRLSTVGKSNGQG